MKCSREEVDRRILEAGTKLFALHGFEGTTTRNIVAEAGSSLSVLQAHYGSKERLFKEIINTTMTGFDALYEPVVQKLSILRENTPPMQAQIWELIEELTNCISDWAFDPGNRYKNLLIQRELLITGKMIAYSFSKIHAVFSLYQQLFELYSGKERSFASVQLSFAVITEIFDMANYPYVLEKILQTDLSQTENRAAVQENTRIYLLEWIRTALACSL